MLFESVVFYVRVARIYPQAVFRNTVGIASKLFQCCHDRGLPGKAGLLYFSDHDVVEAESLLITIIGQVEVEGHTLRRILIDQCDPIEIVLKNVFKLDLESTDILDEPFRLCGKVFFPGVNNYSVLDRSAFVVLILNLKKSSPGFYILPESDFMSILLS